MYFINGACCTELKTWIEDNNCPFEYTGFLRFYTLTAPRSTLGKNEIWMGFGVFYCPLCGTKFPEDLVELRMKLLKELYGVDDPYYPEQRKKIPPEFYTEEWWQKRNLGCSQDDGAAQEIEPIKNKKIKPSGKKVFLTCCGLLKSICKDSASPLYYTPSVRLYWLSVPKRLKIPKKLKKTHADWPVYKLKYCTRCGTELPSDLTEIRLKILKHEYGITDPSDPVQTKRIPKEFMTDKWWKERDL